MGYSTEFEGHIVISPPASPELVKKINEFCDERHGTNVTPYAGMPGFWCDLFVSENGSTLTWNGAEKTYELDKWIKLLISRFFEPNGHKLSGFLEAQGESYDDSYEIEVNDNDVKIIR